MNSYIELFDVNEKVSMIDTPSWRRPTREILSKKYNRAWAYQKEERQMLWWGSSLTTLLVGYGSDWSVGFLGSDMCGSVKSQSKFTLPHSDWFGTVQFLAFVSNFQSTGIQAVCWSQPVRRGRRSSFNFLAVAARHLPTRKEYLQNSAS